MTTGRPRNAGTRFPGGSSADRCCGPEWKLKNDEWWNTRIGKRPFPEPRLPLDQVAYGLTQADVWDIVKRRHWAHTGPPEQSPSGIVYLITVGGQNLRLCPWGSASGRPGFRVDLLWRANDEDVTDRQIEAYNRTHPHAFAQRVADRRSRSALCHTAPS